MKILYAGEDESGTFREGEPFVLACALSYNAGETKPYEEGKSPGKQKHLKSLDFFGDFRFLAMRPDMLENVKKIVTSNHGSPEYKLRIFSCAYLLSTLEGQHISAVVDSFAKPEKLEEEITRYWGMLAGKRKLTLKCEPKADGRIPIVNRSDAIARYTFRKLRSGIDVNDLGREFDGKYVDTNSDDFLERFASALY